MSQRIFRGQFPSIFQEPGDTVAPYRCPLCSADDSGNIQELVDEHGTYAVMAAGPDPHPRYQEYWTLLCHSCGYRYRWRPRGKWYSTTLKRGEPMLRNVIRAGGASTEIGKWQDYRITELAEAKRYSSYHLNPSISNAKICVLLGAGFSAPLGFPTARDFGNIVPSAVVDTVRRWLSPLHGRFLDMISDDYLRECTDDIHGAML